MPVRTFKAEETAAAFTATLDCPSLSLDTNTGLGATDEAAQPIWQGTDGRVHGSVVGSSFGWQSREAGMKEHIIKEIQRLAAQLGRVPGQEIFSKETGIADHQWRGKYWSKWGEALADAGQVQNNWNEKLNSKAILDAMMEVCRHFKAFPTVAEYKLYRQSNSNIPHYETIRTQFGTRAEVIAALIKHAAENQQFEDVVHILPRVASSSPEAPRDSIRSTKMIEGFVYLIQSGDFFKIGRSDDLERRIKEIRVALPDKAVLIHTIRTDDPAGIEAYWHQRFKQQRANGEWFKLTSLDISAFKKRKFQ